MADYDISYDWRAVAVPRWIQSTTTWLIIDRRATVVSLRFTAPLASAADQDLSFDWLASTVALRFTALEDWNEATSLVGSVHYDVRLVLFKLRGMDATTDGLYDYWLSTSRDQCAQDYRGELARPLRDVVVIDDYGNALAAAPSTKGIVMPDTLVVIRVLLIGTTPQQLTTTPTPVKTSAFIKAASTNTAAVALVKNGSATFTDGLQLNAGDPAVVDIDDLSKLWFVTNDPGQSVAVAASQ